MTRPLNVSAPISGVLNAKCLEQNFSSTVLVICYEYLSYFIKILLKLKSYYNILTENYRQNYLNIEYIIFLISYYLQEKMICEIIIL